MNQAGQGDDCDAGVLAMPRRQPEWHLVFILYASEAIRSRSGSLITQECVYLVKASTAVDAYKQAMEWASPWQSIPMQGGEIIELPLAGIVEVMPVWESFEHGNELGYRDGRCESWETIKEALLMIEDVKGKKSTTVSKN
jgi:hypothetical protein